MNIIWHGQTCFQIAANCGKSGQVKIVIDPFSPEKIGLKLPQLEADILLVTHYYPDYDNVKAVKGSSSSQISEKLGRTGPFLINDPGEYEIKEVFVRGIPALHDNPFSKERGETIIFTMEAEGMRICHLGDLNQKELTGEQLEAIGEIDILMVPIGGIYTIDAKTAVQMVSQIEAKIIIPMHYQIPRLKIKLDGLEKFFKALGVKTIEPLPKLSIKKKDLLAQEVKIIVLEP